MSIVGNDWWDLPRAAQGVKIVELEAGDTRTGIAATPREDEVAE